MIDEEDILIPYIHGKYLFTLPIIIIKNKQNIDHEQEGLGTLSTRLPFSQRNTQLDNLVIVMVCLEEQTSKDSKGDSLQSQGRKKVGVQRENHSLAPSCLKTAKDVSSVGVTWEDLFNQIFIHSTNIY